MYSTGVTKLWRLSFTCEIAAGVEEHLSSVVSLHSFCCDRGMGISFYQLIFIDSNKMMSY